jgi:glycosyltransferase involved in cell wall biosynthesis
MGNDSKNQNNLRVLIVGQYYWPEGFLINDVARTMSKKGVAVEVLTAKPNYPSGKIYSGYRAWGCQHEIHDEVSIHRIPIYPRKSGALSLALNYLSFVFFGLFLSPWVLRGKKYDVIFVYGTSPITQALPAILLGWIKKCPVVLWVQDLWPESLVATGYVKNKVILKLVEGLVRFIYRRSDLLLVQSKAFIASVSLLASGTPVKYYPNSVAEHFSAKTISAIPDIDGLDKGFTVLFAGNIGTAQAVEVIVDAATYLREYADINFIVVGDGVRRDFILQQAKERDLTNVYLPGRFPVENMPGLMRKASVLLVTLADREIFAATIPNKVQAYMASGRPILACLNGEGARIVLEACAGLAVPAEDGRALAEAVCNLHKMTSVELNSMGENGRHYYKLHFEHNHLVDQLIEYLDNVSQKRKSVK